MTTDFVKPEEYTLHVKHLPVELNEEGITEIFNRYGKVLALFYHSTWAFVTFGKYSEAEYAIRDLHNKSPLYLKVSFKQETIVSSGTVQIETHNLRSIESDRPQTLYCHDYKAKAGLQTMEGESPFYNHNEQRLSSETSTSANSVVSNSKYQVTEVSSLPVDQFWTRGTLGLTEDRRKCISLEHDDDVYVIPRIHFSALEKLINEIKLSRVTSDREMLHGTDSLKHMVGKCEYCSKEAKLKCEKCHSFYCNAECQILDWARHKTECYKMPVLTEDKTPSSMSISDEDIPVSKLPQAYKEKSVVTPDQLQNVKDDLTKLSIEQNSQDAEQGDDAVQIKKGALEFNKTKEATTTKTKKKDYYFLKGTSEKVRIVECGEKGEYWVQKMKLHDAIQRMIYSLKSTVRKRPEVDPVVGKIYAYKYGKLWYRVKIISKNPTKVFYIDYGTTMDVKCNKFREIDMKNSRPFAHKIRLTKKAQKMCKDLTINKIIEIISLDYEKDVTIVDVKYHEKRNKSADTSSTIFNVSKNSNKSQNKVEKSKTEFVVLKNVIDLLTKNLCGYVEVNKNFRDNTYGVTIVPENYNSDYQKICCNLPDACDAKKLKDAYTPNIGEFVCGLTLKGGWVRGCVIALQPALQVAVIDDAKIVPVKEVVPCPAKYNRICKFGAICEITTKNLHVLEEEIQYQFKVITCTDQPKINIKVNKTTNLTAVLKPWNPEFEQINKQLPTFTSGSEVCVTSYVSPNKLYVRSLQTKDLEEFHYIMQNVAKCAQSAVHLQALPTVGEMVIAQFIDGNFYRAIVKKIEKEEVTIFYVDYGNYEKTSWDTLQKLPTDLKLPKPCAVKVTLKDIPADAVMNEEVTEYFIELTIREVPLKCHFEDDSGVNLILSTGKSVNDQIKGLLTPSWEKDKEKDKMVYMLHDIRTSPLGEVGETTKALVLAVLEEGVKYFMCLPNIDLIRHVYDVMSPLMNRYCEKANYYIPRQNELCLGLFQGSWYRAVCLDPSVSVDKCNILFLDYGNIENVAHKDIRAMVKDFMTPDTLCNLCIIDASELKESEKFSTAVSTRMSELIVASQEVVIEICEVVDEGLYVIKLPEICKRLLDENLTHLS